MKKITNFLTLLLVVSLPQSAFGQTSYQSNLPLASVNQAQDCKIAQVNLPDQRVIFTPPKQEMRVTGGSVQLVPPQRAGLSLSTIPNVKRVTFREWSGMKSIPQSGLYLVETQFIPASLPKQLKQLRYTLKPDGTLLDETGKPITLFLMSEVFEVKRNPTNSKTITQASTKALSSSAGELQAANPYPFSYFSWSAWWKYDGGFCRNYRAWTTAEAWGPLQGGARPHTRIQYMETRAQTGSKTDRDSCSNCDEESSYVKQDIGCWWRAHGKGFGSHYANWKDGNFSATRTWSWQH